MTIYLTDEHIQISRGGYEPRTDTIQINSKIHKALRERFGLWKMKTPNDKSGEITEKIMVAFFKRNKDAIIKLDIPDYNKVYSYVYNILADNLTEDKNSERIRI